MKKRLKRTDSCFKIIKNRSEMDPKQAPDTRSPEARMIGSGESRMQIKTANDK
jgi:hypothetical protein